MVKTAAFRSKSSGSRVGKDSPGAPRKPTPESSASKSLSVLKALSRRKGGSGRRPGLPPTGLEESHKKVQRSQSTVIEGNVPDGKYSSLPQVSNWQSSEEESSPQLTARHQEIGSQSNGSGDDMSLSTVNDQHNDACKSFQHRHSDPGMSVCRSQVQDPPQRRSQSPAAHSSQNSKRQSGAAFLSADPLDSGKVTNGLSTRKSPNAGRRGNGAVAKSSVHSKLKKSSSSPPLSGASSSSANERSLLQRSASTPHHRYIPAEADDRDSAYSVQRAERSPLALDPQLGQDQQQRWAVFVNPSLAQMKQTETSDDRYMLSELQQQ